jgi:hypothetical protein
MDDYLNYTAHSAVVTNERCANADPSGKEYWRHLLETTYTSLCPAGWRLPTQSEYERTVNDWYAYLLKTYVNTGEDVWLSTIGSNCQQGYISFVTESCLKVNVFGQRTSSINPLTYIYPEQAYCNSAESDPREIRYSGYARCVRDL